MNTTVVRRIVRIDEERCNGCGLCVPACAEGALQIIDGKARLLSESFCDGLGACLGECPQDAISIEVRECGGFDEEAIEHHLQELRAAEAAPEPLACGCPSATVAELDPTPAGQTRPEAPGQPAKSQLRHWPVQLALVPPSAPFLRNADLLLVADCVPFAHAGFHQELLKDHALLVACPKLDDFPAHQEKLAQVLRQATPRSLTVLHMEVPCCFGLLHMAGQAAQQSGRDIPLQEVTITVRGEAIPS